MNKEKHTEAERHSLWKRNVIDEFKELSNDEIKSELEKRSLPFAVLVENFQGDYNISSCMRNANAFGAREFFYLGKKNFDRRGALGVQNYLKITNFKEREEIFFLKEHYHFVGIENVRSTHKLENYNWKTNKPSLLIFGEEGIGITPETLYLCDDIVEITQRGSVRSINASSASAVAMFSFSQQWMNSK